MKVQFESEQRPITLLSSRELLQFDSEMQARIFLTAFAFDPVNMETLRRVLGEEYSAYVVSGLEDHEVLDHIAKMITHTCYGMVRVELRDMVPADAAGAENKNKNEDMLAGPLGELIEELLDVIPKPVLPPIFPEIARIEVGALEFELKLYNITLDLLRFVGFPIADISEIADEFIDTAAKSLNVVIQEAESFGQQLLGLATPANLLDRATEIGATFNSVAVRTGELLLGITTKSGELLDLHRRGMGDLPAPSEVVPELRNLVDFQATSVLKVTRIASTALDNFRGELGEPEAPSQLADLMKTFSDEQGQGVVGAASRTASLISQMFDKPSEKAPEMISLVLNSMQETVAETGAGVVTAARGITDWIKSMAPAMPAAPALPTREELDALRATAVKLALDLGDAALDDMWSERSLTIRFKAAEGAAAIEEGLARLKQAALQGRVVASQKSPDDWRGKLGVVVEKVFDFIKPPAWAIDNEGKPSEVVGAVFSAVRDQASGIVDATRNTLESLQKLKPAVKRIAAGTGAQAGGALGGQAGAQIGGALGGAVGGVAADATLKAGKAALSPLLLALAEHGIDLGGTPVLGPDDNPSEVAVEVLKSVFDQQQKVGEIVRTMSEGLSKFAPPIAPKVKPLAATEKAAAPAPRDPDAGRTLPRPAPWRSPEPPPVPEWNPPEVVVPPGFGQEGFQG